jgi:glycosyltransferase involved in cell wall biosynthesis
MLSDAQSLETMSAMGATCHDVSLVARGINPLQDLKSFLSCRKLMLRIRPDVVMSFAIKPVIYGMLAARSVGIEKRFALISGLGYAFDDSAPVSRVQGAAKTIARKLYTLALKGSAAIIFQNADDRDLFKALGVIGPDAKTALVSGSGVNLGHFEAVPPPPSPPVSVLMIARVLKAKGVEDFIHAAETVSETHHGTQFHLVGWSDEGPDAIDAEMFEALSNGTSIVQWHGAQSDVRPFLRDCHIYTLPSYREGTPRSVLEAMAVGRPSVVTDVPGCRETVVDGESGYMVPVRDPAALADAIGTLVGNSALRERMGEKALERVKTKFDVDVVNADMLRIMGL